ncbi:unannotated protein [freshwater metagenome]|uniref:Unannotated protein n=1 Tax=freshwater metagenome TaxID=449393 RepID=A0A6J7IJR3_9ZZZZ
MSISENADDTDDTLVPVIVSDLRIATIDDQTVILDRSTDSCHVLNGSSTIVWASLDGERMIGAVIDELAAESGMERQLVSSIVHKALDVFVEAGIVDLRPESAETLPGDDEAAASAEPAKIDERAAARHARRTRRQAWAVVTEHALDRLPGIEIHGPWQFGDVVATIATNRAEIGDYLDRILEPLRVSSGDVDAETAQGTMRPISIHIVERPRVDGDLVSIYEQGRRRDRNIGAAQAIETTLQRINQWATASNTGSIMLHAGAVEFGGSVVVVAGQSGRGKSTLTAALVQSGGGYVTDELVMIDPSDLQVRPYPKALDLGPRSLELLGLPLDDGFVVDKRHVPVGELGEVSAGGRVAALILLEPENSEEQLLGDVDAVTELLSHVFAATHTMPDSMTALARLCRSVPVLRLPRSTPESGVERIKQALGLVN